MTNDEATCEVCGEPWLAHDALYGGSYWLRDKEGINRQVCNTVVHVRAVPPVSGETR